MLGVTGVVSASLSSAICYSERGASKLAPNHTPAKSLTSALYCHAEGLFIPPVLPLSMRRGIVRLIKMPNFSHRH